MSYSTELAALTAALDAANADMTTALDALRASVIARQSTRDDLRNFLKANATAATTHAQPVATVASLLRDADALYVAGRGYLPNGAVTRDLSNIEVRLTVPYAAGDER